MRSGTIKKREAIVPETIKKRLESYPGWSDLVRLRKKRAQYSVRVYFSLFRISCFAVSNFHVVRLRLQWRRVIVNSVQTTRENYRGLWYTLHGLKRSAHVIGCIGHHLTLFNFNPRRIPAFSESDADIVPLTNGITASSS